MLLQNAANISVVISGLISVMSTGSPVIQEAALSLVVTDTPRIDVFFSETDISCTVMSSFTAQADPDASLLTRMVPSAS